MMDVINALLTNSKFWTALFLLIQAIVFYAAPNFPKEIWAAIDAFVSVVISIVLVKQVRDDRAELKRVRENLAATEGVE